MDITELSRIVENLIRIGTVLEVDHDKRKARISSGGLESHWLKWREHRAGETTTWDPPTVGEQCVILSPSGQFAAGIILFGIPSDEHNTPSTNPAEHVYNLPDGARFSYNHDSGHLEITGIKTATVRASESITNDTPLTHLTGKLVVDDLLTYNNGLAGTGGQNGSVIHGDINHQGNHTHSGGKMTSNGIVADEHTHGGVIRGGDSTDQPQ